MHEPADSSVRVLEDREKWMLQQRWRETYATHVKQATGKWTYLGFDWHAFSYHRQLIGSGPWPWTILLEGRRARDEYATCGCPRVFALPARDAKPGIESSGSPPPDDFDRGDDICIVPPDFSWTMYFTHHRDGFGPYFARASRSAHA